MKWIRKRISAIRAALSADHLPERVFWRFVLANFVLLALAFWLVYYDESGNPIWSAFSALLTTCSVWLLPVLLFRVRGVSRFRATISLLLAATVILLAAKAAFTSVSAEALAVGGMDPGTGAWVVLSTLALSLFRGLWQTTKEFATAFTRIVNSASAAALYVVIALWAGTAFHPMFQMVLNGPLDKLNPARIAEAERYLNVATTVVSAVPIQPIVLFLAFAVLTAGAGMFGRAFSTGKRFGMVLSYASLVLLGLTSYTYVVSVAAPVSLQRIAAEGGKRLAGYRDRYSSLILSHAAVAYLTANPRAVLDTKHVLADAHRGCRAYNDVNGIESDVEDRLYRYYDDVIGEEYQWFNIGTETINCAHREYYRAYTRAIRGSLRIAVELADSQAAANPPDKLFNTLNDIDRLSAAGAERRVGDIAGLISRSQEADVALRAAEYVVESKLGDLAAVIIGEDNSNWLKPVLREFVDTLISESAKEGFAKSIRTLTAAKDYGRRLAEANASRDAGLQAGGEPYRPPRAVDEVARAAQEFSVTAKVSITKIRIEEGGDWRIARNLSKADLTILKITCVIRPTSCRHVF